MALTGSELLRKVTHMSMGMFAFLLRFLGPFWSAVLALTALAFNLFLFPRIGGKKLWRDAEHASGTSIGIVLYPLAVLILILVFWKRLEVAAAVWGILAFGDGMASVVGMTLGRKKLSWNPKKSWMGTAAYFVFGTAAAALLLTWTAPGRYSAAFALAVCAVTALFAAALESLPQGLDDNIGVPLVSGLLLLGLVLTQGRWDEFLATDGLAFRLAMAALVNAALAGTAYAAKTVNRSGVAAGFLVGFIIYAFLDWEGYLLLLAFFIIGSACTKLGYRKKEAAKLAQEDKGRRGARHALANVTVAAACAVFAALTPYPVVFALAFAGAFATAASDTSSSEIGQLIGRRTFLLTNFRPVPRGTEGAVSVEGTLAGVFASLIIAVLGAALGLFPWVGVVAIVIAAFVGTTFESLVGAALEKRQLLDNEALNFLNTLVGALVAVVFTPLVL
ncbi:MAG TPA: TIGR00297 family protein [Thermoanaerobaculia bacterium]|nr:TIGR00297 family protein [Thermoanaerobaculia bacterium]